MIEPSLGRDRLFGFLALRMGLVTGEQLAAGLQERVREGVDSLGQLWVRQGVIDEVAAETLLMLVERHLGRHGGDVERCLESLGATAVVHESGLLTEVEQAVPAKPVENTQFEGQSGSQGATSGNGEGEGSWVLAGEPTEAWQTTDPPELKRVSGLFAAEGPVETTAVYRDLRPLAAGGLGEVYVAKEDGLNREVALKLIREGFAGNAQSRARFLMEAEVTGGLEHPSIVPIYAVGEHKDGRPYYAMRLIRGESLREAILRFHAIGGPRRSPLVFRQLLTRLIVVCNAVEYAHSRGILHRDLKPSNILLGKYGETMVVDWGLAKPIGRSERETPPKYDDERTLHPVSGSGVNETVVGSAVGTASYMSPEQALGRSNQLGPMCDVYSLGATLYCILTGQAPLEGISDLGEILARVIAGDIPAPCAINRGIPKTLEAICRKAMSLRPADRYSSARALAEDLERYLADERVPGVKESLGRRITRWERRNRLLIRVGGAALATIALVTSGAAILVNGARERAEDRRVESEDLRLQATAAQWKAETLATELALDRGLSLSGEDRASEGLLWMTRSLGLSPGGSPALDRATRLNVEGWKASLNELRCVLSHSGPVSAVAVSPDGLTIATACEDGAARLWGMESGESRGPLLESDGPVRHITFSPDGTRLLTGSDDGTARLWDAVTGMPTGAVMKHEGPILVARFSQDSGRVITASEDRTVQVWDASSGQSITERLAVRGVPADVRLSGDGRHLLSVTETGPLQIWDPATGERRGEAIQTQSQGKCAAFSPDGSLFAVAAGSKLLVGETASAKILRSKEVSMENLSRVLFTPDGERIITCGQDTTVLLFHTSDLSSAGNTPSHRGPSNVIALSPDGSLLASGAGDNTAQITSLRSYAVEGGRLTHSGPVVDLAFSPEGRVLVTASRDGMARVWDIDRKSSRASFIRQNAGIRSQALFSPDGSRLAICNESGEFSLWSVPECSPLFEEKSHSGIVYIMIASPDGTTIATGGDDHLICVREAATGKLRFPPLETVASVRKLAFDERGSRLAGGTLLRNLYVWDGNTGSVVGGPWVFPSRCTSVVFLRGESTLALGMANGELQLWDVEAGRTINSVRAHGDTVRHLALSSDGRHLASASNDNTARVWDAKTLEPVTKPLEHRAYVWSVCFSPDNRKVLTASFDTTAHLWDATTGEQLARPLQSDDMVFDAIFSPDGRLIATASRDHTARLWDVATGLPIGPALAHSSPIFKVTFSPDGRMLATVSADHSVGLWRVPEEMSGEVPELKDRVARATGLELGPDEVTRPLTLDQLRELGLVRDWCDSTESSPRADPGL